MNPGIPCQSVRDEPSQLMCKAAVTLTYPMANVLHEVLLQLRLLAPNVLQCKLVNLAPNCTIFQLAQHLGLKREKKGIDCFLFLDTT